ncbi:MAG: hypothetical protein A3E84_05600 [Gammaproteobacteria bacterium RIFCSPHIGHO2_12_FULL_42_13]|nr:MAG: hypothetical protein A3E84_05600 [Gammaproteobacteria bacterium RIFCSPHIGHO2_12_FULL_42_13]
MKKVSVILATVASAWIMTAAAGGVAVVDMKEVFTSSPKVKQLKDNLTKQFNTKHEKLEKVRAELQADIAKFQKNKEVMSKDDVTKTEADLAKRENAFQMEQSKFQQELMAAQNKSLESFMNDVKNSVQKVAEKQDLDLVVPDNEVLYTKGNKNITKDVLKNLG